MTSCKENLSNRKYHLIIGKSVTLSHLPPQPQTTMRYLPITLVALTALFTTSCDLLKPKDPAASAYDPYGQQSNPYGQAAATNPYSQVPAANNPYGQAPATNPYGQAPATNPYGSYEPAQTAQPDTTPAYTAPANSGGGGGGGGSVTVKSGDTLTSIARRNKTTVSALRSANGLSGDLIRVGQRLNLP
jgi:LysM repeat protein